VFVHGHLAHESQGRPAPGEPLAKEMENALTRGCSLRPLLSAEQIDARVSELAAEIAGIYRGRELAILPILSGSLIFVADLIRRLPLDMIIHLCGMSSYRGEATQPAELNWTLPPPDNLCRSHVLIIDDILDSGRTLRRLVEMVAAQRPASLRTCVLLARESAAPGADFVGFRIGPGFVVGYGLDFDGRFRNLPHIAMLER
jgi:hypoxanthine phosphoribosyltransferase